MRILGIDPGTATTGFGVIEEINGDYKLVHFGCIKTSSKLKLEERLKEIANDLTSVLRKFKPDYAAVEEIFFSKNTKTAISVAHARGVIIQKLNEMHVPICSYNPLQIKQALCNYGKADKSQIQKMVQILLNLNFCPKPDDAADALAIAMCHGNFIKNQSLYSKI